MDPVYFETRVRTSQPVTDWPSEFVILSAFATTGESWTPHQNERADYHLASELRMRGGWFVRIFGYSPKSGHSEPSWDLPLDEGCNILDFAQWCCFLRRGVWSRVARADLTRTFPKAGASAS